MIRNKMKFNRRNFLRGVGTTGLALPFLESLPERSAFAQDSNATFGLFVIASCGVVQDRFYPGNSRTGTPGALTTAGLAGMTDKAVSVLADHADRLLIMSGMNFPNGPSGCAHAAGLAQSLTAARISGAGADVLPDGTSVDTEIAKALGVTPLSLYAGIRGNYIEEKISFTAPKQVRAAIDNPFNVYKDLAGLVGDGGGTGGDPTPMADQLAIRRKSVNDLVREDLASMMNGTRISYADKLRLQLHLDSIRDLENNMNNMNGVGAVCTGAPISMDELEEINGKQTANGRQEDVVKLHMELAALAFSCNHTRVATLQAGDGTDGTQYTINGQLYERFHHISHRINGDGNSGSAISGAVDKHHDIDVLRMQTLKHGIDKWAQFDTPNGPLLDNGFIYWSNHVADGPSHSLSNVPVVIAGSGGGYLKQGQMINVNGQQNGQVLATLMNANGVKVDKFGQGNAGLCDAMIA